LSLVNSIVRTFFFVQRYQPKTVTSRLKTLTQDAETESEVVAEDFMDKKMEVAKFSQKHKEQRKLYHLRKIKYEKLTFSGSTY